MNDRTKTGDISVKMGNNNTIEHIGHKIIYHAPPPNPNAIWQNGKPIGVIGSEPIAVNGGYFFQKLFFDAPFDEGKEFTVQGIKMMMQKKDAITKSSTGDRPAQITFFNAVCQIIR